MKMKAEVLQRSGHSTESENGNALLAFAQMRLMYLNERVEVTGVFPQMRHRYVLSLVHAPSQSTAQRVCALADTWPSKGVPHFQWFKGGTELPRREKSYESQG